jgi:hypothetical protein
MPRSAGGISVEAERVETDTAPVRSHWKPIVALLLVTPFLTELLSGSLPAPKFFQPQLFLFLATVGYGFPILLLREFAVRHRLGILGLLALGLVYGIFNEGVIAKTFYLVANVPVRNFDGYGYAGGIAIPWAVTISIWHALHSFLYPVVAVYYFFPGHRESPWLNWKGIILLAIPTVVLGTLIFFSHGNDRAAGLPAHFILMAGLSGLLIWLATKLPAAPALDGDGALKLSAVFWGGLAFLLLIFVPVLLAGVKFPAMIFYGYYVLTFGWMSWMTGRQASLSTTTVLLFALGDDSLLALVGLAGGIGQMNILKLVTNAFFLAVFIWLFMRLRKAAR